MSSDEYALALAQKYRLAISMAVLKTKPENLTVIEYINEIRDVIIDTNNDPSQQDLDMTACSADFNTDDDDDEITKIDFPHNFNCDQDVKSLSNVPRNNKNNSNNNKVHDNEWQIDSDYRIDDKLTDDSQVNDKAVRIQLNEDESQSIVIGTQDYCSIRQINDNIKQHNGNKTQNTGNNHQNDGHIIRSYDRRHHIDRRTKVNSKGIHSDMTQDVGMIQDSNGLQESTYRIQDYGNKTLIADTNIEKDEKNDPNKKRRDKFREIIRILKGVDVPTEKVVKEKPTTTPGIIKSFDPTDSDLTQCYETNDTFLLLEAKKRKTYSNKQKNTNTDAKLLKITKTDDIETVKINPQNSVGNNNLHYAMENNNKEANNKGQNEVNYASKATILDHGRINNMEITNNTVQNGDIDPVGVTNTQDTQFNTHYSESQMFDLVIDKNLIYGNRNQSFGINTETYKLIDKDYGNTNQENTEDRTLSIFSNERKDLHKSQYVTNNTTQNEFAFMTECQDAFPSQEFYTKIDKYTETGVALPYDTNDRINKENNTEFTIDILQNDIKTVNDLHKDTNNVTNKHMFAIQTERENLIENNTAFSQTQDTSLTQNSLKSIQVYEDNKKAPNKDNELDTIDTENENDCTDVDKSEDKDDAEITEKVPFKILEEMNQIKSYLSKKREFKDSGYKSSQSQRSGIGSQPSSVRVGESADAVFIYLSNCPLDVATQDLTEQISEVLGQIIDRLHEEEIYPKFLEELLNTIEKLLHSVHEEENYDFDVLQKKDEQIQRILLLNKSLHINKFTIEKINNILQKLIDEISDTKYEIQEINKLENLCYIFHILEMLLPKYKEGNLYNSQKTQTSQEQKVLKKQDISDIWRRKWFPNVKEDENEGSFENKCVLKECCTILNKIIVDFMDGYSLIAFSALKCFNLIQ